MGYKNFHLDTFTKVNFSKDDIKNAIRLKLPLSVIDITCTVLFRRNFTYIN